MSDYGNPVGKLGRVKELLLLIAHPLNPGENVFFIRHPGKSRLIEQNLGKHHCSDLFSDQCGVNRQLRFSNPLPGPVFSINPGTGFVIDDDLAAICQLIDPVDHQIDLDAFNLQRRQFLAGDNRKRSITLALDRQPEIKQTGQATRLKLPEANRQGDPPVMLKAGNALADCSRDLRLTPRMTHCKQGIGIQHSFPKRLQHGMHQSATRRRVKPFDRRFNRCSTQAILIVGPGRTNRLRPQDPAPACHLFTSRNRWRKMIFNLIQIACRRLSHVHRQRVHLRRCNSQAWHAGNQGTGPQYPITLSQRIGKTKIGRRQQ